MRKIISTTAIPEVNDLVKIPILEGEHKISMVGKIARIRQHCGNCPRYVEIINEVGVCVFSPDIDDIFWSDRDNMWIHRDLYDEDNG